MNSARILVVDDNRDFVVTLTDALELNGFAVDTAFTGENAIQKYRESDYDYAFIDVKLPGMNGVDSYIEIKKINPAAKVIIMTGYSVEQLLKKALLNGAVKILYKPFDMQKALELIQK